MTDIDPAVATWQAALAASQADLTRVERERDEALRDLAETKYRLGLLTNTFSVPDGWAHPDEKKDS
jgi:FMN phosphatase YigB (HAD superfamily)